MPEYSDITGFYSDSRSVKWFKPSSSFEEAKEKMNELVENKTRIPRGWK
ncbi:MAG: hypothetical protein ACLFTA_00290 [Candidatus Nanohaloarchaea archaeon]